MNENTVRKLRRKFIIISFLSLLGAMMIIAGLLYYSNVALENKNIRNTLQYIVDNEGHLPGAKDGVKREPDFGEYDVIRFLNEIFNQNSGGDLNNPEFYYTTRYFAIIYDDEQNLSEVIVNHIAAVTESEAETYGEQALMHGHRFGRYGEYYYQVAKMEDGGTIVVYLDSSNMLKVNNRLLYLAMLLLFFGILFAGILVYVFSFKAIEPEIKNMKIQKQFITNASHELKTPLSVIKANTEMQEMLNGENEWTQSTLRQVNRMSGLIQNLVMVARADEHVREEEASECDITKAVKETTETFSPVIQQDGKKLFEGIKDNVTMVAADSQIRQLCSLLMDNAIKYCDENGTISVILNQRGKGIVLTVSNNYKDGKDVDYSRFFERFYREDRSHNTDKGGYGIGLSIAESIVEQYRGAINVNWKNGIISFQCILKQLKK